MSEKLKRVVFDAGPIIHLDELNCLDLLGEFQEILLAENVWNEINYHRPLALPPSSLSLIRCPQKYPTGEQLSTMCRTFSLDSGEIGALAIMENNPGAVFFTDDTAARLVAEQMRFKVHGTIGILVRSIRQGQMKPEQVLSILKEIPQKSTLHIKSSLLEKIIRKIEDQFQL
jgi:predicted nucleic acid-binding protein